MSDQPLFQNTDEQEAAYAPQQLPADSDAARAAALDDHDRDSTSDTSLGVPAAGAGLLGQAQGGGFAGGATGAIGPGVAAAAPEDETSGPPLSDTDR